MVRKLLAWAIASPFIIILLACALVIGGGFAFTHVNVEAYPDPAPAIIEVVAQCPGASAEEVERLVTIPLEVALAGMPHLQYTRSKSLFGLAHLRNQFDYSKDFEQAKQEVINRLQLAQLPPGVTPQISPATPTGEILRYTLSNPRDALGRPIYTLNDLKSLQDYTLQREFLRVPRIAGVAGSGGTIKRYEIHPDPDRLRRYGLALVELQRAISSGNGNGSGDNLVQGQTNLVVRSIGLFGLGEDPMQHVLSMRDPVEAAKFLRKEEARRIQEIRQTVVASVNNAPVRVDNLVDGGPQLTDNGTPKVDEATLVRRGVVVANQTRQGKVSLSRPRKDANGHEMVGNDGSRVWEDDDERVQAIVLLRKGEESLPALHDLEAKIHELNEPGHLLPGVQIEPYYDRTDLINLTTETVHENLLVGLALVSIILLMFLNNVRVALIVALNIPLDLFFAFGVLFVERQVRQPAFHWRRRFRHHRRFHGHSGGEHLSPSEDARGERHPDRRTRADSVCRSRTQPLLFDLDHGVRPFTSVHHDRPRRSNLRTYGRYVRLRPGGRPVAGAHDLAGAMLRVFEEFEAVAR